MSTVAALLACGWVRMVIGCGGLVTAVREPPQQDPHAMLIQLVRRVEEGAWFTVLSPGTILQHGSRVLNNAELCLESVRYPDLA